MVCDRHHSLTTLRRAVLAETGVRINRSYLETILKNPFYTGQGAFAGRHQPKYRKHNFAFAGLQK